MYVRYTSASAENLFDMICKYQNSGGEHAFQGNRVGGEGMGDPLPHISILENKLEALREVNKAGVRAPIPQGIARNMYKIFNSWRKFDGRIKILAPSRGGNL